MDASTTAWTDEGCLDKFVKVELHRFGTKPVPFCCGEGGVTGDVVCG